MGENQNKIEQERQMLQAAQQGGLLKKVGVYTKLSGPGWLQSALTLGGGSLSSGLYLGVLVGVSMLWVQPLAMIMGIIMLSAISYVTLSTGKRPFRAINEHVNPVLGWSWLLASLAANIIWVLPQYSLCYGVIEQNLAPGIFGEGGQLAGTTGKYVVSAIILIFSTIVVWSYGSGSWGIKLYELFLKVVVGLIVACFVGVVITMALSTDGIDWQAIWAGCVPDLDQLFHPAKDFQSLLDKILNEEARNYWTAYIVNEQRDVMFSAAATAVGINMTFLLPYSMLARGWDKNYRGLAIFDLSTGMFIPFVLATSCVVIAAAGQFHAKTPTGLTFEKEVLEYETEKDRNTYEKSYQKLLKARDSKLTNGDQAAPTVELSEQKIATTLLRRKVYALAKSLSPLMGDTAANWAFGFGVAAMAMSSISLLMLISGFIVCEVMNVPTTGWPLRLGCMLAATGVAWPIFWDGDVKIYLAIVASLYGGMLLPIAYFTFFLFMNQKSLLKENAPTGMRFVVWNLLMIIATFAAGASSVYVIWMKTQKEFGSGWYGIGLIAAFFSLVIYVQIKRKKKPTVESS